MARGRPETGGKRESQVLSVKQSPSYRIVRECPSITRRLRDPVDFAEPEQVKPPPLLSVRGVTVILTISPELAGALDGARTEPRLDGTTVNRSVKN
jgi:hypothetical protein